MKNRAKTKVKTNAHEKHDEKVVLELMKETTNFIFHRNSRSNWREKTEKNPKGTRMSLDFHKVDGI